MLCYLVLLINLQVVSLPPLSRAILGCIYIDRLLQLDVWQQACCKWSTSLMPGVLSMGAFFEENEVSVNFWDIIWNEKNESWSFYDYHYNT